MSLELFKTSQLYTRKSANLTRLGFDFNSPIEYEFLKIQSILYSEYHIKCESMILNPESGTLSHIFGATSKSI